MKKSKKTPTPKFIHVATLRPGTDLTNIRREDITMAQPMHRRKKPQ